MQWSYADGRFAQVSCTTRSPTPTTVTVIGTDGWLRIERAFYDPPRIVVSTVEGGERTIERGENPHPYGHEVDEVARCLRAGAHESNLMTWSDTVAIMELMDDVRRQIGVRYPADDAADGSV